MEELEVYTIPEVAKMLRVNQATINRLIHLGKIGAYKIGRAYRIPKKEVNRFLDNVYTDASKSKAKKRVSLEGIFNNGNITDKDIDEATKIWTSRELP